MTDGTHTLIDWPTPRSNYTAYPMTCGTHHHPDRWDPPPSWYATTVLTGKPHTTMLTSWTHQTDNRSHSSELTEMTHRLWNISQKASAREFEPSTSCAATQHSLRCPIAGVGIASRWYLIISEHRQYYSKKEEQLWVEPQTSLRNQSAATTEPPNTMWLDCSLGLF
jgi:hypothetical protein